jgi:aspartate racemase
MRKIGIIGGTSWESTAIYYRRINQMVRERLGRNNSARLLIESVNLEPIHELQEVGAWDELGADFGRIGQRLVVAGAEALMIGSNTMHRVFEAVASAVNVPVLHLGDATGAAVRADGLSCVGFLGTRFTMTQPYMRNRIAEASGATVLTPPAVQQGEIHRVIFEELCQGVISPASKDFYLGVCAELLRSGAEGIILGCTEIGLLIGPEDFDVPVFDTAELHARMAVEFALSSPEEAEL